MYKQKGLNIKTKYNTNILKEYVKQFIDEVSLDGRFPELHRCALHRDAKD